MSSNSPWNKSQFITVFAIILKKILLYSKDADDVNFRAYLQGPIQLVLGIPQAAEVHQQFGRALSSLFQSHEPVFPPSISGKKIRFYLKKEKNQQFQAKWSSRRDIAGKIGNFL